MAVCAPQRYFLQFVSPILSHCVRKTVPLSLRPCSWREWSLSCWNTREVLVLKSCWWVLSHFLPWSCPWSHPPILCLPIQHPSEKPSHPPPCRCSPSIIDLLFWDSASPPPHDWDPLPVLWAQHLLGRCRAFPEHMVTGLWASACEPAPESSVRPTSQETRRRMRAESSWETVRPSPIELASSWKPVSFHQDAWSVLVPWCNVTQEGGSQSVE